MPEQQNEVLSQSELGKLLSRLETQPEAADTILGDLHGPRQAHRIGITGSPNIPIPQYFDLNRAIMPQDIPHKFVLSSIYALPFGKGKQVETKCDWAYGFERVRGQSLSI